MGLQPSGILMAAREKRKRWEQGYREYARMRGFHTFNDWPFHRRGFLECWGEPGFHRFWQIWNPGIAFFIHHLYLRLGGRKHWVLPTILSFVLCGLVHTIVAAPFLGRWGWTVIVAFGVFGLLTVMSRMLAPILRQERWPVFINVVINVGLVLGGFDIGFRVDRML